MSNTVTTSYFPHRILYMGISSGSQDFAVALHRMTGWPIAALWRDAPGLSAPHLATPLPLHVFCIAPNGKAVDVEGVHSDTRLYETYRGHNDTGRLMILEHGDEKDWEQILTNVSPATMEQMLPYEENVMEIAQAIRESQAFQDLLGTLSVKKESAPAPKP